MADDLKIIVPVELDTTNTVKNTQEKLKNNKIEISAILNENSIKNMQKQLKTISKNIKIDVSASGNIDFNDTIKKQVKKTQTQLKSAIKNIEVPQLDIFRNTDGIIDITKIVENAKEVLSEFGTPVISWSKNARGELNLLTAQVKKTTGEIETLKYKYNKKKDILKYSSATSSEKGIIKQAEDVEKAQSKYEAAIASFEKSNNPIIDGLEPELTNIKKALNNIGNSDDIEEINNQFNKLKATASEITKNLKPMGSSFDPVANSEKNLRKMPEEINKLELGFRKLSESPRGFETTIANIREQLSKVNEVKEKGTSKEWSVEYSKLVDLIEKSKAKLGELNSAEKLSGFNSNLSRQEKYYKRLIEETTLLYNLEKKRVSAGQEETKELEHQISNTKKRILYNQNQLDKYGRNNESESRTNDLISKYENELKVLKAKQSDKSSSISNNISDKVKIAQSELEKLEVSWKNSLAWDSSKEQTFNNLRKELDNVGNNPERLSKYSNQLQIFKNEMTKLNKSNKIELIEPEKVNKAHDNIIKLINDIKAYENVNRKAMKETVISSSGNSYANWSLNMRKSLELLSKDTSKDSTQINAELQKIKRSFANMKSEIKANGLTGGTFLNDLWDKVKRFSGWMGITGATTELWHQLKQMVANVIELDSAMVDLRKVTNATESDFKRFFDSAGSSAKELGASVTDVINSTAEFSRLGYGLGDAEKLGKVATLYQQIGDGISAEDASKSIISTMKAFGYEADRAEEIVDKFNEVGNNYSISSAGIGEGLQRSAAALAGANNDLSQSIALMVGANDVIQDPLSAGTMWKTVSMRIRGAKTELEEMGEDTEGMAKTTAELQNLVKSLTGFDILEQDQKTFKSTYDIVLGIAKEWKELNDTEQASLLEKLAGKRQGNALQAAIDNVEDIKAAYETAENSAGSAMREHEEYSKGIQYSLDKLKATLQTLSADIVSSDFIKGVVNVGGDILNIIDKIVNKLGVVPGLIAPITAAIMSFKNVGRDKTISLRIRYADCA